MYVCIYPEQTVHVLSLLVLRHLFRNLEFGAFPTRDARQPIESADAKPARLLVPHFQDRIVCWAVQ